MREIKLALILLIIILLSGWEILHRDFYIIKRGKVERVSAIDNGKVKVAIVLEHFEVAISDLYQDSTTAKIDLIKILEKEKQDIQLKLDKLKGG